MQQLGFELASVDIHQPGTFVRQRSTMVSILASGPSCPGFNSQCTPKNSEEKIVNVVKVNQRHCLEESEQWLENVDWNHLVSASLQLVLQKLQSIFSILNKLLSPALKF